MLLLRVLVFAAGLATVVIALLSTIKTFLLPRSASDPVAHIVFVNLRLVFQLLLSRVRAFDRRDAVMAFFAPISLLALLPAWLAMITLGYAAMYWALGVVDWYGALVLSGSSLLTLGFARHDHLPTLLLTFSEATVGLMLVAILIAYLPTIYGAFARREAAVAMLEVRAGSPPSAVEMIKRFQRLHGLDQLNSLWVQWELWFTDLAESHTSLPVLVFFRSPQAEHSWVTAAGTILDSAALINAVVDIPHDMQADLTIRAGYLALRHIADFFEMRYNRNPRPDDPITISREEFDAACAELAAQGVPLKPDREAAWRDFSGWRVNYDAVLTGLAEITMAPFAPWSSDRLPLEHSHPRWQHWLERMQPGPGRNQPSGTSSRVPSQAGTKKGHRHDR